MNFKEHLAGLYRVKPPQGRDGYLRLDMNENPEGLPEEFVAGVLRRLTPGILARYPETGTLVNELASFLGIDRERLFIGNGSDGIIKSVFELFAEPGKRLVSVYPTFEVYAVYAKMFNMEHVAIAYDRNFKINFAQISDAIDRDTAIVSVLNPNSPIGNAFSDEQMIRLIEKAEKAGAPIIIDEAYYYFHRKSFIDYAGKYDNIILIRTFSKLCSIAGLRIGYAVSSPQLISYMNKIAGTYSVNCVAVEFARAIIADRGMMQRLMAIEDEGREYILKELRKQNRIYFAENGNYILIKCERPTVEVYDELKRRGILVKTYSYPLLNDYIRITTGSKAVMERFWHEYTKIIPERN